MIAHLDTPPDAIQLQQNRLFAGIPAELITDIGANFDLLRFDAVESHGGFISLQSTIGVCTMVEIVLPTL